MPNKPTDKDIELTEDAISIIAALGCEVVEQFEESFDYAIDDINSRLQFLADADLIHCEDSDLLKRNTLYFVMDYLLDQHDLAQADKGEEQTETERAY